MVVTALKIDVAPTEVKISGPKWVFRVNTDGPEIGPMALVRS